MNPRIDETEIVIFDTETTGLEPKSGDRVIELAAVRFKGAKRLATFESFLNPRRPVSEAAFRVNRISAEMLQDAPDAAEVLPRFMEFIQGSCLCSYNAGFDLGFLNNELVLIGSSPLENFPVVDILKMARRLLPGMERYPLWFVARHLGVTASQEHRAMSDVEMTLEVFWRLKNLLDLKGIVDFSNFTGLFGLKSGSLEDSHNQKIAEIQRAIDQKLKIKIKYLSTSTAVVTEREVIPREIRKENRQNYLVGYCCLKNDERNFRLDGILHLEIS